MDLFAIRYPVTADLTAVDALILRRLNSEVSLINQIGYYIINNGGKRLRPLCVLLAAHTCGYKGIHHIELAAIIEFIHTATLLHDDVIDGSKLRRNRETANVIWGNEPSVLVGDFLYSRAFQMMVQVGNMKVMEILSHATNRIAEGEVLQLLNNNDPDTSEARYLEVIARKTATLFEAGTKLGAVLADSSLEFEKSMAHYGNCIGIAFQLIDDVLDYDINNTSLGKNIGDDLEEGKPTLPIIRAMAVGTSAQRDLLSQAITEGSKDRIQLVIETILATDAISYTMQCAHDYAKQAIDALQILPPSLARESLVKLAEFAVQRKY